MKPNIQIQTRRARTAGFTLIEMMTALFVFTLLTIAIVSIQFFATRVYTLAATKLTATAAGRNAVNYVREQVRSAKFVYVGNYDSVNTLFSNLGDNTNQIGSAIYLCPTTNQTYGTVFYKDQVNSNLLSVNFTNCTISANGLTIDGTANGLNTNATCITNLLIFQAEDYQGNVLTNNNNNRIIHLTLCFSRWEYPIAGVGISNMYDYYQLHTRVTRRALD
jgi:prepilin-type N-terminal cleavage/methylation domain-containing protein